MFCWDNKFHTRKMDRITFFHLFCIEWAKWVSANAINHFNSMELVIRIILLCAISNHVDLTGDLNNSIRIFYLIRSFLGKDLYVSFNAWIKKFCSSKIISISCFFFSFFICNDIIDMSLYKLRTDFDRCWSTTINIVASDKNFE